MTGTQHHKRTRRQKRSANQNKTKQTNKQGAKTHHRVLGSVASQQGHDLLVHQARSCSQLIRRHAARGIVQWRCVDRHWTGQRWVLALEHRRAALQLRFLCSLQTRSSSSVELCCVGCQGIVCAGVRHIYVRDHNLEFVLRCRQAGKLVCQLSFGRSSTSLLSFGLWRTAT